MTKEVHILSFYDDILCEIANWAPGNWPDDEAMISATGLMGRALSAGRHDVPEEGLQAVLRALPAFVDAHPSMRTYAMHLEKYLATVLNRCEGA